MGMPEPDRPQGDVDPTQVLRAANLMINQGAGLLWNFLIEYNLEEFPHPDFFRQNYHKCVRGIGNALLWTYNMHSSAVDERESLLGKLFQIKTIPDARSIFCLYKTTAQLNLHPSGTPPIRPTINEMAILAGLWNSTFLHIEGIRTGKKFLSPDDYRRWMGLREPSENDWGKIPRNLFLNLSMGVFSWRHPREALFRRLPFLLLVAAQPSQHWRTEAQSFLKAWKRFHLPEKTSDEDGEICSATSLG